MYMYSHCYEKDYSTELTKELAMMLIFTYKLIFHSHHVQVTLLSLYILSTIRWLRRDCVLVPVLLR